MSINVWPTNRQPYHGDIIQGRLGNCFLIASLQALASCQTQLLKSIISLSPLTCFFYRQGQRIEIPIELKSLTDEYQYCRSTLTDVQWPYIIEQAYAQFYGGRYENLAGGNTSEALYDLLGKPVQEFEPNDNQVWEKIEKGFVEKNLLVTCGAVVTNGITTTNINTNGLSINHAYAILATFIYQRTKEKYVLIHNPHGTNHISKENTHARDAFFTSISKSHPLWNNTPGTQLLSWTELKRICNRIQICYLNVESRQILFDNWSQMTSGGCSNFSTFYRNPFILLPTSYLKNIIIVLGHMIDQRHERTETDIKLNYTQLGMTVIQLKSHLIPTHCNYETIYQSKFWNKREVALNIDIEHKQGQQYAVVLSTYYPNLDSSFWVQIFSKQTLPEVKLHTWINEFQQPVQTIKGEWHRGNAGGRRNKSAISTFYQNPAYFLTLSNKSSVRLILHQLFETDVPLNQYHPIGIYVLSSTTNEEPLFTRARSVSRLVHLNGDEEYYIVPACFGANLFGKFEIDILCDVPFTLDTVERKLPMQPPIEIKTASPSMATRKVVTTSPTRKSGVTAPAKKSMANSRTRKSGSISPTRKTITTTRKSVETRTTATKDASKKGNLSLAAVDLSTLIDEYSKQS